MIAYSALFNDIPAPPDTVVTLLLTGGSSAQAADWPSTLAQLVRVTGLSTAGAAFTVFFNARSTHAAVGASGTSVTTGTSVGSTGNTYPIYLGVPRAFQIPGGSTGWSVAAYTSGLAIVEIWKR